MPEILMVPVQQNVTVEIGLMKSNKRHYHVAKHEPDDVCYVVCFVSLQ